MPRLLIFLPCEKVIVSKEGPISLITVFEAYNVALPEEEYTKQPDDAVLPSPWHVFTKWIRDDNEELQLWEQRIQVSAPDGRISTDTTMPFDLVANPGISNIVRIDGLAIKPLGRFEITLSLRKGGENDAAWQKIASYPLIVKNVPPQ